MLIDGQRDIINLALLFANFIPLFSESMSRKIRSMNVV
jgi:hypothetical protein